MKVKIESNLEVSPIDLIADMSIKDMALLISAMADKLDGDFIDRVYCANEFAEGMTENCARFMAEMITQRFAKKK